MGPPSSIALVGGQTAYNAFPNNVRSTWIKDPGLRRLNFGVGLMFCSAAANGFDGSLMNGLLALPQCQYCDECQKCPSDIWQLKRILVTYPLAFLAL